MKTDYEIQFPESRHMGRLVITGTIDDFRKLEKILLFVDMIDPELNDIEVKLRREVSTIIADLRDYQP